ALGMAVGVGGLLGGLVVLGVILPALVIDAVRMVWGRRNTFLFVCLYAFTLSAGLALSHWIPSEMAFSLFVVWVLLVVLVHVVRSVWGGNKEARFTSKGQDEPCPTAKGRRKEVAATEGIQEGDRVRVREGEGDRPTPAEMVVIKIEGGLAV